MQLVKAISKPDTPAKHCFPYKEWFSPRNTDVGSDPGLFSCQWGSTEWRQPEAGVGLQPHSTKGRQKRRWERTHWRTGNVNYPEFPPALLPRARPSPGLHSLQPTQALRRLPSQITLIALQIASRIQRPFQLNQSLSILFGDFKQHACSHHRAGYRVRRGAASTRSETKSRSVNLRNQRGKQREGYRLTAVETAALVELVPIMSMAPWAWVSRSPAWAGVSRGVWPWQGITPTAPGTSPPSPALTQTSPEAPCSYRDSSAICSSKKKWTFGESRAPDKPPTVLSHGKIPEKPFRTTTLTVPAPM